MTSLPAYGATITVTRSTNRELGPSVDEASAIDASLRFPSPQSRLPPADLTGTRLTASTRLHRGTRGSPPLSQRSESPWPPHPPPGTRNIVGSERTMSRRRLRRRPKRRYSRFCFLHACARSSGSIFWTNRVWFGTAFAWWGLILAYCAVVARLTVSIAEVSGLLWEKSTVFCSPKPASNALACSSRFTSVLVTWCAI